MVGNVQGILDQELFAHTLTRERKRSERSGLALALLSVGLRGERSLDTDLRCAAVATALSAIKSDIDIVGWCEHRALMGLLCPEIDPENLAAMCDRLDAQCRYALARQGDADLAQEVLIRLRVYPEPWKTDAAEQPPMDPLFFPELHPNRQRRVGLQRLKRSVDILRSLLLLIMLSPLLLVLAALVKLSSPGPVIFRQVRVGQMMKPFMMWKFRTMYVNADHAIHHHYVSWFITSSDKGQEQSETTVFKLTNDTRITPIGHFLRRTSLDEL
ncbi:MAG: sugar transferase, partial [Nitrospira sp.]|nr:sugar transferase [Nitrospira sp.]